MRIVHISDCFLPMLGGIEMQVSQLASKQQAAGNEVLVFACAPDTDGVDRELPYRVFRSVWDNPFGAPVDPRAPKRFLGAIRAIKPDVVHVHIGEATPVAETLLWRLRHEGVPVLVTVHSVWNEYVTQPLYNLIARGFADSPIAWTGVSQLVASRVGAAVGSRNVRVLPNGVDAASWLVDTVPHAGLVAVTAARFAPRKRMQPLLAILGKAIQRSPQGSLQAVLAGAGPQLGSSIRWVHKRGLERQIQLPGRLSTSELKKLYAGADVFVSPSVKEAASIAAAEAQAAGLAILTRSQSGLGERISSLEGAAASTDSEMVEILVRWAKHPAEYQVIKEYNREHGCPLDWHRVLPEVFAAYEWARERATAYGDSQN